MSDENAIEQSRAAVAAFKSERAKKEFRNSKDIRDEIAKGNHYQPKDDPIYEYKAYPKWVGDKIVNSKAEHDALLGVKPEPAKSVSVDVAALATIEQAPPARRGRPPKAPVAPLPAALD